MKTNRKMRPAAMSLVMTGILVRHGYETGELLSGAAETASRQGWKRALLVYLGRLQIFYEQRQEGAKADKIRQRILLIQ